jgi:putative NADH-flavin reductase
MRYGILGATGLTGKEILKLLKGKDVSVYVRSPGKLPADHGAKVTQASLTDSAKLTKWASEQDVVFTALGHALNFDMIKANLGLATFSQDYLLTKTMAAVIAGKPKRIVDLGAYGTHETRGDLPWIFGKFFLPLLIARSYADHESVEDLLAKSSVEWVVARPGRLTNEPAKGVYRTQERFNKGSNIVISRADVADFMVRSASGTDFLRKRVGLSY